MWDYLESLGGKKEKGKKNGQKGKNERKSKTCILISTDLVYLMGSCFSKYSTAEKMLMADEAVLYVLPGWIPYICQNSRLSTRNTVYCLHGLGEMGAPHWQLIR